MARIIQPTLAPAVADLLKILILKNADDLSVLKSYLIQQEIKLEVDKTNINTAVGHDVSRLLLSRQSENARQLRDLKFEPVFARTKGIVQFLKSFYKPNFKALGDWGIPVLDGGRIAYPEDVVAQMEIFDNIKKKSDSLLPEDNPLKGYLTTKEIDLVKDAAVVAVARENNEKFIDYAKKSEVETGERDQLQKPVMEHLRLIGDFLKNLYGDNVKELGLWGYVVDNSAAAPKDRTTKLKLGEQITIKGVTIGGTVKNIGTGDIHLYKGKTTTGTPAIIHPGESFGIAKGYSVITVVNPSLLISAKFTVLVVD